MQYGLSEADVQKIRLIFAAHPEIEQVIIYGSRAKGNYKPASDIDLTIKGELLTTTLLFKIEDELDDLLLPYKMDISIFRHLSNPDLIAHIIRVGQAFYIKK